jgi:hypothetical protein
MNSLNVIKAKAKSVGVNNPSSDKKELIPQIQTAEGFTACYKTKNECDTMNCCWRGECLKK